MMGDLSRMTGTTTFAVMSLWLIVHSQAQRLFISEIITGADSTELAFEIYNPLCRTIGLDAFTIEFAEDGGDWVDSGIDFTGEEIGAEGTYLVCHTDTAFGGDCGSSVFSSTWDGNDGIALLHNGVMIDHWGDAARWDVASHAYDTSNYVVAGGNAAANPSVIYRKPKITQGIGSQRFTHPNGRNNNDEGYSQWLYSADLTNNRTTSSHNAHSLCDSAVLFATCGLTGDSSLLSDNTYYDLDRTLTVVHIQIDCPMDCAQRSGNVIGGTGGVTRLSSSVCLAGIHSGAFVVDTSRLPVATADTVWDEALSRSMCQAGAIPIITPFVDFPVTDDGVVSSRNRGRPRLSYDRADTGSTQTVTGFDGTCITSADDLVAGSTFTVTYLDVTHCTDTCETSENTILGLGGSCDQGTGKCMCYDNRYSSASTNTENNDDCYNKYCDPPCQLRQSDNTVVLYSSGGPCTADTGECDQCEFTSPYGSSGDQCLGSFSCHSQGGCGNVALDKTVTGSSGITLFRITDGNPYDNKGGTSTFEGGSWIEIDLEQVYKIGRIRLYIQNTDISTVHDDNDDNQVFVTTSSLGAEMDVTNHAEAAVYTVTAAVLDDMDDTYVIDIEGLNVEGQYVRYQDDDVVSTPVTRAINLRGIEVYERTKRGECSSSGHCECNYPFYGVNCELQRCTDDCNNNGACDPLTGVCTCDSRHLGETCAMIRCKSDCSGHGVCDFTKGICSCETGVDDLGDCRSGSCPGDCSGNGLCDRVTRVCSCNDGFGGEACSITVPTTG